MDAAPAVELRVAHKRLRRPVQGPHRPPCGQGRRVVRVKGLCHTIRRVAVVAHRGLLGGDAGRDALSPA